MNPNEKILENVTAVNGSNAAAMNQAVYQHPAGAITPPKIKTGS